jgi:hypothetical protein
MNQTSVKTLADSYTASIDDSSAREDWGWNQYLTKP